MAQFWNCELDDILSCGVSLEAEGVHNFGLDRQSALHALTKIRDLGYAILGGDVFEWHEGRLVHTYDNWCAERLHGESFTAFVGRSNDLATRYVSEYPVAGRLFALVPLLPE